MTADPTRCSRTTPPTTSADLTGDVGQTYAFTALPRITSASFSQPRRRPGDDVSRRPAHQLGQLAAGHDHKHQLHPELERFAGPGRLEHRLVHNLRVGGRRAVHGVPHQHHLDFDDLHRQRGHTYGFYSVATDNLGDVQPTPTGAQATTKIVVLPTSSVNALPASTTNTSFPLSWSGRPGRRASPRTRSMSRKTADRSWPT